MKDMRCSYNPQLVASILLFASMQAFVAYYVTNNSIKHYHVAEDYSYSIPSDRWGDTNDTTNTKKLIITGNTNHSTQFASDETMTSTKSEEEYSCFPSRHLLERNGTYPTTIVYLETAFINLHYETYYSFIHEICSCRTDKDPIWTIDTNTIPEFWIGPDEMLTVGFERVLKEYNTTTCGPIHIGTPPNKLVCEDEYRCTMVSRPDLTIVTTSYPANFEVNHKYQYHKLIDDSRYIFVCHEDGPTSLENATNVYFLTPKHNRYIVPSYFPPSIVSRHAKGTHQLHPEIEAPIFLVIGSFHNQKRRNVQSLVMAMMQYKHVNFTIRFLGGASGSVTNQELQDQLYNRFPAEIHPKLEFFPRTDTDEFMMRVSESDVLLPLVDETNFWTLGGYQGGRKLTSSVMWALGFRKRVVLYRPLAETFGIEEDNRTYFLHEESRLPEFDAFAGALGRCLDSFSVQGREGPLY